MPPGLRRTLYFRDDDLLHSFLFGSFVTLTNLTERDWEVLEKRRLSPLRVSVHTTDPDLRRRMLGNPKAPDIMEQLRRLGELGIRVHAQVVLCPGVNDGPAVERTISDLVSLAGSPPLQPWRTETSATTAGGEHRTGTSAITARESPGYSPDPTTPWESLGYSPDSPQHAREAVVESVALVPVGLSLPLEGRLAVHPGTWPLRRFTPAESQALMEWAGPRQEEFRRTLGRTFLHLADEFYILAQIPLPEASHYDGFPQYQNGIGMVRTLLDDWGKFETRIRQRLTAGWEPLPGRFVALCGTLIAPVLGDLGRRLAGVTGRDFLVVPVENRLFGPRVTVSGLLPGRDLAEALPALSQGDVVLVPRRALEATGRFFLDSMSLPHFRRLASPAGVVLVERPGDLGRALWGRALKGGTLCAA